MKTTVAGLLFLAVAIGAAATRAGGEAVVIELGGISVTRSQVDERFQVAVRVLAARQGVSLADQSPGVIERLREQYLDKYATELVMLEEAGRRDVQVPEAEVDAAVEEVLSSAGESGEFAGSIPVLRQIVRDEKTVQLLTEQLLDEIVVPPGDVITLHHDIKDSLATPERACIRHVQTQSQAAAEQILDRARGGADFAGLAREQSTDESSREAGGDLGCFEKGHTLAVSAFEKAAFAANEGDIVGPVESELGYHVIEVYEHTERYTPTLQEAYEQVERELAREQLPKRLNALIQESGVRTYPENFAAAVSGE